MMGFLSKVFSFIKGLFTRPGLDRFLDQYLGVAKDVIQQLMDADPETNFHTIKQEAFHRLKAITGQLRDTWISIVLDLAYETLKAKRN
jgi:hypothetical protein